MADLKWKCTSCGGEGNTGAFCLRCGAPRNGFTGMKMPVKESASSDHGPLTLLDWTSSRSGMMMYSGESFETKLEWKTDGSAVLTEIREREGETRTVKEYRVGRYEAEAFRKLVSGENAESWSALRYDWDHAMRPTDVSTSARLSLTFAAKGAGARPVTCGIDLEAAVQQGKREAVSRLRDALERLKKENALLREETQPLLLPNGMSKQEYLAQFTKKPGASAAGNTGLKPGEWRCGSCGAVNTGKFCCECGSRRPD